MFVREHSTLAGRPRDLQCQYFDLPLGVDQIETQFVAAAVPPAKNVVVDLSRVKFIASMGIRMLVSVARSLQQRRARLVLYGPSPLVNEVFEHVSLRDLMPIVADETAAIAEITS